MNAQPTNAESSEASAETSDGVSAQGRRVLLAIVTGEPGERIQRWREREDEEQARRYPPHVTLCYDATGIDVDALARQVTHAFVAPVTVRLGGVGVFDNPGGTAYVEVLETEALDAARERLYDGTHVALPYRGPWAWHITCLRRPADAAAIERARAALDLHVPWEVRRVELRELRGAQYDLVAAYDVGVRP